MDAKQEINNIQQITENNNFGGSEGAKADLHQGRWQLVNISDIFLDPIDQWPNLKEACDDLR